MKAAVITNDEGPEGLQFREVEPPRPGPDEIVVSVKATALNRADLLQTMGLYPAPPGVPAEIPGLEYAGVVAEVGSRVQRWRVGDRVMGIVSGGAWAEQLVTHEREAMAIPPSMDFTHAAAVPEAFITAYDAIVLQGQARANDRVLIHAVASGVGTAAIQLCRLLGATAIGTGRNAEKLKRAQALGLEHALHVTDATFAARVMQLSEGRGADVALDLVGGDYFPETVSAMASGGTIMVVGLVAGPLAEVPLRSVLYKRLSIIGTTLRARHLEEKIAVSRTFERTVLPSFASGSLKPVIDATFPMLELKPALARLAENDTFGKLVLTW